MGKEYKVYNEHQQIVGYVQGEDSELDKLAAEIVSDKRAADRLAESADRIAGGLEYDRNNRFFAEHLEADRKSNDKKAKERLTLRNELLQMNKELLVFETKKKQYLSSRRCFLYIGVLAAATLLCLWSWLVALIFGIICIFILQKKGEEIVENLFAKSDDGKKMKELGNRWEEVYTDLEYLFDFNVRTNYNIYYYLDPEMISDSDEDDEI